LTEMSSPPPPLVAEIIASLRNRYTPLNRHYEVWWTDSWLNCSCQHVHSRLGDAARCGMSQPAGWYVVAVEYETPRQLTKVEEQLVNVFRFAAKGRSGD